MIQKLLYIIITIIIVILIVIIVRMIEKLKLTSSSETKIECLETIAHAMGIWREPTCSAKWPQVIWNTRTRAHIAGSYAVDSGTLG